VGGGASGFSRELNSVRKRRNPSPFSFTALAKGSPLISGKVSILAQMFCMSPGDWGLWAFAMSMYRCKTVTRLDSLTWLLAPW